MTANRPESRNGGWDPRSHPDWAILLGLVPAAVESGEMPGKYGPQRRRLSNPYDTSTAVPLMLEFGAEVQRARAELIDTIGAPAGAIATSEATRPEPPLPPVPAAIGPLAASRTMQTPTI